jgi:isoleucyl-tRNA synthetase
MIGSSLEAKVLLYVFDPKLHAVLQERNSSSQNPTTKGVDELRYLFIASQVELLDSLKVCQG